MGKLVKLYTADVLNQREYIFLGTPNIYNVLGSELGIAEAVPEDYERLPVTSVRELIRADVIIPLNVVVDLGGKSYRKTLYYNPSRDVNIFLPFLIDNYPWPTGQGKGGEITGAVRPARVKTRT